MRGSHFLIALIGVTGVCLAYSGLIFCFSGTSDLGFPLVCLGLLSVYLTKGALFKK